MRHLLFLGATLLVGLVPSVAPAQVYGDSNALVDYWYRTYLGRAPDPAMAGWVAQLNRGTPADAVLAGILGSDEYYGRGGSTPQGFVALLYNDIQGRPPTLAEVNYWVRRMYSTDRAGIADAILVQNPGVWVRPRTVVVTPRRDWERDRHGDWDRYHDIHEYRRPDNHFPRDERDERDRR